MRGADATTFWSLLDDRSRWVLLEDQEPEVREAALAAVAYEQQVMEPADLPDRHCHAFWQVLQRPLSRALIDHVLASGDQLVRLAADPAVEVRTAVSVHPGLSEEQRAGIDFDASAVTDGMYFGPRCPDCYGPRYSRPGGWTFGDLGVRVLLAQHHPAAPPALLLRCYLEYHGHGRDRLIELPNFPTDGLDRFAE